VSKFTEKFAEPTSIKISKMIKSKTIKIIGIEISVHFLFSFHYMLREQSRKYFMDKKKWEVDCEKSQQSDKK
jgi:hypothetical protein